MISATLNQQRRIFQETRAFRFYLGCPNAAWLHRHSEIPLFVSRRQMPRARFQRAVTNWALDSGGFSELQQYGEWTIDAHEYSVLVNRYHRNVGRLQWAAQQDWMCEPVVIEGAVVAKKAPRCCGHPMIAWGYHDRKTVYSCNHCVRIQTGKKDAIDLLEWTAWASAPERAGVMRQSLSLASELGFAAKVQFYGTGLSVREHQERTVQNFLELDGYCQVPIIPVIQGFTLEEYHECIDLYAANGVDLAQYPTVGVGSICRRQATQEAVEILRTINSRGINIHGFGLKREALKNVLSSLASADSMAWSFNARYAGTTCGKINQRTGKPIKNCANCHHAAVEWYTKTMEMIK